MLFAGIADLASGAGIKVEVVFFPERPENKSGQQSIISFSTDN
jgi:hypothetical protein